MVVAYCGRVGLVCMIFWISKKLYLVLVSTAILYVFLLQKILLPLNMDKNESLNCSNICAFVNIISASLHGMYFTSWRKKPILPLFVYVYLNKSTYISG